MFWDPERSVINNGDGIDNFDFNAKFSVNDRDCFDQDTYGGDRQYNVELTLSILKMTLEGDK